MLKKKIRKSIKAGKIITKDTYFKSKSGNSEENT